MNTGIMFLLVYLQFNCNIIAGQVTYVYWGPLCKRARLLIHNFLIPWPTQTWNTTDSSSWLQFVHLTSQPNFFLKRRGRIHSQESWPVLDWPDGPHVKPESKGGKGELPVGFPLQHPHFIQVVRQCSVVKIQAFYSALTQIISSRMVYLECWDAPHFSASLCTSSFDFSNHLSP